MMSSEEEPKEVPVYYMVLVERLARIEEKLDNSLKEKDDHEGRLRAIERWKYALPITAFTALTSVVLTVIGIYGK